MSRPTKDNPIFVSGVGHIYVDDDGYIMTTSPRRELGRIVKGKIKFEKGLGGTEASRIRDALNPQQLRSKTAINVNVTKTKNGYVVAAASKRDEKKIKEALKKNPKIAYIENDRELRFLKMDTDPVLSSAVYGGLGSLVGAVPGVLLASPFGIWLGMAAGGAYGARAGAPADRKKRGAWGGGIGGAIAGPIGAALGGAIGARKRDKNPISSMKRKLLR